MPVTPATLTAKSLMDEVAASPLGTLSAAPATTSSTNASPFGYSQAQADAILTLVIELRDLMVKLNLSN